MNTNQRANWLLAAALLCLPLCGCNHAGSEEPSARNAEKQPADGKRELSPSSPAEIAAVSETKPSSPKVAALVKLGAKYDTDLDGNVIEITYQKKIATEVWTAIKSFPNLEVLDLDGAHLKNDDLKQATFFKKLRVLSLQDNPITNDGLKSIKDMKTLENLALAKTKVTGDGLANIAGLTKLQTLNLSECNIGDDGLKHLVKMSDLETLALQKSNVTGPGLEHVGKLKNMITLTLNGSTIKGDNLLHLKGLSKLRIINMYDCKVSQSSIEKLEKEISSLAIFTD